jgi:7-cyano-7-deazaguanine reductase
MIKSNTKGLTQLGAKVALPENPEEAELERVPYKQQGPAPCVRFTVPEFTAICPMTGQPDFAHLVIDYVPGKWLVESKSLKLYLGSFRNNGVFHEDCTAGIGLRLVKLLKPKWLWIPEQGVQPYRGRG